MPNLGSQEIGHHAKEGLVAVPELSLDHAFENIKLVVVEGNHVAGDEEVEFDADIPELFLGVAPPELREEHLFDRVHHLVVILEHQFDQVVASDEEDQDGGGVEELALDLLLLQHSALLDEPVEQGDYMAVVEEVVDGGPVPAGEDHLADEG